MKICILGAGLQGRVAAQDLAKHNHEVTILDNNKNNLKKVIKLSRIRTKLFDVRKKKELTKFIKDFDVVLGALPAHLGFYTMQCAVEAGVDIADMSYSDQDPFKLYKRAEKNKVRVIPDAGYAPGLSNVLVGEAYREFGKIDSLRILVGGLPINPRPPFNYQYTWSPDDLVQEYTRPARIVNNYKLLQVEALTGIENFYIPKIGKLECFYTDGLRTLLDTFKDIKNMEEKTIRYRGHAALIKEILNYGFAPDEDNPFTNSKVQPKDFVLDFLKDQLSQGDGKDLTILLIDIKNKRKRKRYRCIDYYDEKNKITSMTRMTAYSGSIFTQLIKNYPNYGVIAPEKLGMDEQICKHFKKEIAKRNIKIKEIYY